MGPRGLVQLWPPAGREPDGLEAGGRPPCGAGRSRWCQAQPVGPCVAAESKRGFFPSWTQCSVLLSSLVTVIIHSFIHSARFIQNLLCALHCSGDTATHRRSRLRSRSLDRGRGPQTINTCSRSAVEKMSPARRGSDRSAGQGRWGGGCWVAGRVLPRRHLGGRPEEASVKEERSGPRAQPVQRPRVRYVVEERGSCGRGQERPGESRDRPAFSLQSPECQPSAWPRARPPRHSV